MLHKLGRCTLTNVCATSNVIMFCQVQPLLHSLLMGSCMARFTYPDHLSSDSGSLASSSQPSDTFSGNLSSQENDESELETPTPGATIWEPRKIRAKVWGSYWVVENDKKCVIFCKMQMVVCTFRMIY